MIVLIDTSVWVANSRYRSDALVELVVQDLALTHPMVIGELACGTPPAPRGRALHDIGLLRSAALPTQAEVLAFIEDRQLYGLGCGLIDIHLLASTLMTPGATLWTLDRRLAELAARFGVAHSFTSQPQEGKLL